MQTGMISGVKRMEVHDGDGLRTTVFFKGCPLNCLWCHNPESLSFGREVGKFDEKCLSCGTCVKICPTRALSIADGKVVFDKRGCSACMKCADVCPVSAMVGYGREYTVGELADEVEKDNPFFGKTGGVTLSGGECLAQPAFALSFAKRMKSDGIGVYVDTCGCVGREVLEEILPYTDKFLYDVKAIDGELHRRLTGRDNALILSNLEYLVGAGAKIEIRYPLVKGYNDGECEKIANFVRSLGREIPIKVLRYHDFSRSRYAALGKEDTLPREQTSEEDVEEARKILRGAGIMVLV